MQRECALERTVPACLILDRGLRLWWGRPGMPGPACCYQGPLGFWKRAGSVAQLWAGDCEALFVPGQEGGSLSLSLRAASVCLPQSRVVVSLCGQGVACCWERAVDRLWESHEINVSLGRYSRGVCVCNVRSWRQFNLHKDSYSVKSGWVSSMDSDWL